MEPPGSMILPPKASTAVLTTVPPATSSKHCSLAAGCQSLAKKCMAERGLRREGVQTILPRAVTMA